MKLATYKDGTRDGQLVVVSRDLSTAHYATGIASRMQQLLDDWDFISPQLQDLYETLNNGKARHAFPFDPAMCMAPLPRAFQYLRGAAYPSHAVLLSQAAGVDAPDGLQLSQAASDHLLGAHEPVPCLQEKTGVDFGAALVVATGDVPQGAKADALVADLHLVMLANEVCLRHVTDAVQSQPATAFAPVAVTRDELGDAWDHGTVHLTVQTAWNGRKVGMCDAGTDMAYTFGQLVAHACKTRALRAGTLVSTGVVSNAGHNQQWPKGYHSIAEKRAMETLLDGQASTDYLKLEDTVRMEVKGKDGQSVFGVIEQHVGSHIA
jgi:fumarylacetoacetate (FAA) hydrolase